jgi:phospho-N-acetylmuramoyl-pentapeptide-transferase
MIYALALGASALVATVIAGYPAVGLLRRLNLGKEISEWGPESHLVKAGTPTMGGLVIVLSISVFTLAANFFGRYSMAGPLGVLCALAVLGLIDDLGSLRGRPQHPLSRRLKLLAFLAIGGAAAWGLYDLLDLRAINIPYDGRHDLGALYLALAVAVVVLTAGGVAVTDGLDGLVAGTMAIAFAAYGLIALSQAQTYLGAFCFTVTGANLGFLWHNSHPAQVFMGEVGALALGGALAVVAFMTGQWLVLPLIGVIFVLEGLSDGLQIGYFKLTGGRRILLMAPLHHHFEKLGWSEVQVVQRFWITGALGAVVGVIFALEV